MPFGMKNAGATYLRAITKIFGLHLGEITEVCIDDMLVKSLRAKQHLEHLKKGFQLLGKYTMKLNPAKCCFDILSGKFLGYLLTHRGIKANPEKIQAILNIKSSTNVKEIRKLTGKIAALNRSISRSSKRSRYFFAKLRKYDNFEWSPEWEEALQQLKQFLANLPLLLKPTDGETFYIYLVVAEGAVSAVFVRKEEDRQRPGSYINEAFLDMETRYSHMEKLAVTLVLVARKLRHYFQCHHVVVWTRHPLRSILHKPELFGRLTK